MAVGPGQKRRQVSELAAEIERSRRDLAAGLRQIEEGADLPARFQRSFSRHPALWSGGLMLAGLAAAAVTSALVVRAADGLARRRRAASVSAECVSEPAAPPPPARPRGRIRAWVWRMARRALLKAAARMVLKRAVSGWLSHAPRGGGDVSHTDLSALLRQAAAWAGLVLHIPPPRR